MITHITFRKSYSLLLAISTIGISSVLDASDVFADRVSQKQLHSLLSTGNVNLFENQQQKQSLLLVRAITNDNVVQLQVKESKEDQHQYTQYDSYEYCDSKSNSGILGNSTECRDKEGNSREEEDNESLCKSNLVRDFNCDLISDPCPVFACIVSKDDKLAPVK
jgi:hypothetical protein